MTKSIEVRPWGFAGAGEAAEGRKIFSLFATESYGDSGMRAEIVGLYDEIRPTLYSNLIFLGLDPAAADDVIQEAFLALFRQLSAGKKIDDIRGWLFRTSHNLSLNTHRQQRKFVMNGEAVDNFVQRMHATGLNPEQAYLYKERMQRCENAIERLTSLQRQCLLLRKEGLRYREIAAALSISLSRVPQILERAIGRLMEEFYD